MNAIKHANTGMCTQFRCCRWAWVHEKPYLAKHINCNYKPYSAVHAGALAFLGF